MFDNLKRDAVVTTDVPENSVVAAFRAEVTGFRNSNGTISHFDERLTLSRRELFERITNLEKKVENLIEQQHNETL